MIRARFFVAGEPATQGSKRIVQPKGHRRPVLIEVSKKLKPWRDAVTAEAMIARQRLSAPLDGALELRAEFYFVRPKKPVREFPPHDLDKLTRAIGDALVTGKLVVDDRHFTAIVASKSYNVSSGCWVTVSDA